MELPPIECGKLDGGNGDLSDVQGSIICSNTRAGDVTAACEAVSPSLVWCRKTTLTSSEAAFAVVRRLRMGDSMDLVDRLIPDEASGRVVNFWTMQELSLPGPVPLPFIVRG